MTDSVSGHQPDREKFPWTIFYEAVAEKLLDYRANRAPLIEGIHDMAESLGKYYFKDDLYMDFFADGTRKPLEDICPFTAMATFNRHHASEDREVIAAEFAKIIDLKIDGQVSSKGVPFVAHGQFFDYAHTRKPDDIDTLWKVFAEARKFAGSAPPESPFAQAYDVAMKVSGVGWGLSTGLHWANPWNFPAMGHRIQHDYVTKRLHFETFYIKKPFTSANYLQFIDKLNETFSKDYAPVRSFPELSLAAYEYESSCVSATPETASSEDNVQAVSPPEPYSVADILNDGCFLSQDEIKRLLDRLRTKKNLILQGPPGTGKTWLAKRLAFALMGKRDDSNIRAVQFHSNLSYEDFVRGWRPASDGKLVLAEGIFMEAIHAAMEDPSSEFAVVIEEINRGNPAQIFGELLTLLEADKRTPKEALELCYPDPDGKKEPIYIPKNLYVIGTMNIADRSLALIDFAFRRRFAFATLEPQLGEVWRDWVVTNCDVDSTLVLNIEGRINALNDTISESLGKHFRVGHSYVTPGSSIWPETTRDWFIQVVETEIVPLLEEYWFDEPATVQKAFKELLEGW